MNEDGFSKISAQINKFIKENEEEGFEKVKKVPLVWQCLLADYFKYNLTQGGFAQLIYNLKGEYLEAVLKLES